MVEGMQCNAMQHSTYIESFQWKYGGDKNEVVKKVWKCIEASEKLNANDSIKLYAKKPCQIYFLDNHKAMT